MWGFPLVVRKAKRQMCRQRNHNTATRWHRNRKVQYPTEMDARKALQHTNCVTTYQCPFCASWHISKHEHDLRYDNLVKLVQLVRHSNSPS